MAVNGCFCHAGSFDNKKKKVLALQEKAIMRVYKCRVKKAVALECEKKFNDPQLRCISRIEFQAFQVLHHTNILRLLLLCTQQSSDERDLSEENN
jgi:hypothetical protein